MRSLSAQQMMAICVVACPLLSGCASSGGVSPPTLSAAGGNAETNCRRITGRMQVRILEYRDFANQSKSSSLARALQSGITSIVGGSKDQANPTQQYNRALAELKSDNTKLAAANCPTFNLEQDLKAPAGSPVPRPIK